MWYKLVLPFTARSKKNNRPIFFNKKIKRPFLGKSKELRAFEKEATKLWKAQLEELSLKAPLTTKLKARYLFYYRGAQRADLCNLIVTLNDLAQDAGAIEDDKQIKCIERADVFENSGIDKCEFWISEIVDTNKPSERVSFNEIKAHLQTIAKESSSGGRPLQQKENGPIQGKKAKSNKKKS